MSVHKSNALRLLRCTRNDDLNIFSFRLPSDRVESRGFRPVTLPHHRTCGFPHPAVRHIDFTRKPLMASESHIDARLRLKGLSEGLAIWLSARPLSSISRSYIAFFPASVSPSTCLPALSCLTGFTLGLLCARRVVTGVVAPFGFWRLALLAIVCL